MKHRSAPPEVGRTIEDEQKRRTWVQTERAAHEAWGRFIMKKPAAGALLHHLVAKMGTQNAVVVSQKVLAELVGVSDRTIRTALADLEAERYIQIVRIGKGREAAYVVNDRVAWGESRSRLPLSVFTASVVADQRDQEPDALTGPELRRIPVLYPGEQQLPMGAGEDPPAQPAIDGLEPDLPALRPADSEQRNALERRGQQRLGLED